MRKFRKSFSDATDHQINLPKFPSVTFSHWWIFFSRSGVISKIDASENFGYIYSMLWEKCFKKIFLKYLKNIEHLKPLEKFQIFW